MRTVDTHLLDEKIEEAMKHFINSQHQSEAVHMDSNSLPLSVQDVTTNRGVAVLHPPSYQTQLCRPVGDSVHHTEPSAWNEELLDADGKLAALVAHLAQNPRISHIHHKVLPMRPDVDTSVINDTTMRLFNGQPLETPNEPMGVQVPSLPPLPQLQEMKQRCQDGWFTHKQIKRNLVKEDQSIMSEVDHASMEMASASPVQNKQSKKSLPHKKRISRKLKRNTGCSTPQQDLVMINCREDRPAGEEILPDTFMASAPHQEHIPDPAQHITQHVRPIFICQLCGAFYGEDQLKFYHHLKHHYESPTIIIENPVADLGIDKMTNTCIVDDVPALPDSLVELSLENTLASKTSLYPPMEKHVLYTSTEKAINYPNNKALYSETPLDKPQSIPIEAPKELYDTSDKQELYHCSKCNKTFKKQLHCELHIKKAHNKALHDMNEFSEPEDLMDGIYVMVVDDENAESGSSSNYADHFLPHLTVDNGHVHQEHGKHWYARNNGANPECNADGGYCAMCDSVRDHTSPVHHLKEEVLQRIFEVEVSTTENQNFTENINLSENGDIQHDTEDSQPVQPVKALDEDRPPPEADTSPTEEHTTNGVEITENDDKKKQRTFACPHCPRVLYHRNSLMYHMLSHADRKAHECDECGKAFYTTGALKIHSRMHNGVKPYKCSECGRDFRQFGDLKYHISSLHSKEKQYKCEYCPKEFARKYSLTLHRRIHTGERNYKCHLCNKSFRASCYRVSHMRTHTGEKPHKCEECGKCFRGGGDLRRHMLMHEKARARLLLDKGRGKGGGDSDPLKSGPPSPPAGDAAVARKRPRMSTTKLAVSKTTSPTAKKPTRSRSRKADKCVPNVTVVPSDTTDDSSAVVSERIEDIKIDHAPVEKKYDIPKDGYATDERYGKANDARVVQGQLKMKTDHDGAERLGENYIKSEINLHREYTMLRPLFRSAMGDAGDTKPYDRPDNTDGKGISVYTLVDKPLVPNQNGHAAELRTVVADGKHRLENVACETSENGFIERLTAFYNIAHV